MKKSNQSNFTIKGQYHLTLEDTQVVVNEVKKIYNDFEFEIERSPNKSNSFYIYIRNKYTSTVLRLSDHLTKKDSYNTMLVVSSTAKANVCYKIENAIRHLKYKTLIARLEGNI